MTKINNFPQFAEEITIEQKTEQRLIQAILNKSEFKQLVSAEYIELTNAKKNNWGSTEDLDKPLCERYLFVWENKRIWLDITYDLMEELELPIGKACPWPFYLKPEVLKKEEVEGAITIKDKKEIFIDKPISEKDAEKELVERLKELKKLKKQAKEFDDLQCEKEELKEKVKNLEENIQEKDEENKSLDELFWKGVRELESERNKKIELQTRLDDSKTEVAELKREMGEIKKLRVDTSDILAPEATNTNPAKNDAELIIQANEVMAKVAILRTERDARPSITLDQWNNDYSKRPTQQQLINLQQELRKERGWWGKWIADDNIGADVLGPPPGSRRTLTRRLLLKEQKEEIKEIYKHYRDN